MVDGWGLLSDHLLGTSCSYDYGSLRPSQGAFPQTFRLKAWFVVTHVPSIVLCWDYQHRIRRLQNGQPSLVPVSLLVCPIFKLSRQIVSWHSGISSSLPTIFSTERPWWSNSVLSSTGYKTLINSDISMRNKPLCRSTSSPSWCDTIDWYLLPSTSSALSGLCSPWWRSTICDR